MSAETMLVFQQSFLISSVKDTNIFLLKINKSFNENQLFF